VLVSICLISAHKGGAVHFLKIRRMVSIFFRHGEVGRTSKLIICNLMMFLCTAYTTIFMLCVIYNLQALHLTISCF